MKGIYIFFTTTLLFLSVSCFDQSARQSVIELSRQMQALKQDIAEFKKSETPYTGYRFLIEDFQHDFSQEAFTSVLQGNAVVKALGDKSFPEFAKVEIQFQLRAENNDLLVEGVISVPLTLGEGELLINAPIPVMMTDADSVNIHFTPLYWYPIYLAKIAQDGSSGNYVPN